jgi:hypothetical protein
MKLIMVLLVLCGARPAKATDQTSLAKTLVLKVEAVNTFPDGKSQNFNLVFFPGGHVMDTQKAINFFNFNTQTILYRLHTGKDLETLTFPTPPKKLKLIKKDLIFNKSKCDVYRSVDDKLTICFLSLAKKTYAHLEDSILSLCTFSGYEAPKELTEKGIPLALFTQVLGYKTLVKSISLVEAKGFEWTAPRAEEEFRKIFPNKP